MFKVNNKPPERSHWHGFDVFIVNLEHISHLCQVLLLVTNIMLCNSYQSYLQRQNLMYMYVQQMVYVRIVLCTSVSGVHIFCSPKLGVGKILLMQRSSLIKSGFDQRRESFERLVKAGSKTKRILGSSSNFWFSLVKNYWMSFMRRNARSIGWL